MNKPLVPAWMMAAGATLTGCLLIWFVKTRWPVADKAGTFYSYVHSGMGVAYAHHGDMEKAKAEFHHALELDPSNSSAANQLANALLQHGEHQEAETAYMKALEIDPANADALNNLGLVHVLKGDLAGAIPRFQKAVELKPDFFSAYSNLGYALIRSGRFAEAETALRTSLKLQATANAHNNLGLFLSTQGRHKEAAAEYEAALKDEPAHMDSLTNLAWIRATAPDTETRNGAQALELTKKAMEVSKQSTPVLERNRAAALAETGKFDEAAAAAEKAIDLANAAGDTPFAQSVRAQLLAYREKRPWRESKP